MDGLTKIIRSDNRTIIKHRGKSINHRFALKDLMMVKRPRYMQRECELTLPKIKGILLDSAINPALLNDALKLMIGFPDKNGNLDYYHENTEQQQNFDVANISRDSSSRKQSSDTDLSRMHKGDVYAVDGQQRLSAFKYYFNKAIESFFKNKQRDRKFTKAERNLKKFSYDEPVLQTKDHQHFDKKDVLMLLKPWISYAGWLQIIGNEYESHIQPDIKFKDQRTRIHVISRQEMQFERSVKNIIQTMRNQLMDYDYEYPINMNGVKTISFDLHMTIGCEVFNIPRKYWNSIFNDINGKGTPLSGYQILDSRWERYGLYIPHFKDYSNHRDIGNIIIQYSRDYLKYKSHKGPKEALIATGGSLPNVSNNRIMNLSIFSRALGNLIYDHLYALNCGGATSNSLASFGIGALRIMTHNMSSNIKSISGKDIYNKVSTPYKKNKSGTMQLRKIKPQQIRKLLEILDNLNAYFTKYLSKPGSYMQKKTAHKAEYVEKKLSKKKLLSFIADLWNDKRSSSKYKQSLAGIMLEYLFNDEYWIGNADKHLNEYIAGKRTYRHQNVSTKYWMLHLKDMLASSYKNMDDKIKESSNKKQAIRDSLNDNKMIDTLIVVYAHEQHLYEDNGFDDHGYDVEHILPLAKVQQYEGSHNMIHVNHFGNLTLLGSTFNKAKGKDTIYQSYLKHHKSNKYDGVNYKQLMHKINYFVNTEQGDYTKSSKMHYSQENNMMRDLKKHNFRDINDLIQVRENIVSYKLIKYFCDKLQGRKSYQKVSALSIASK